MSYLRPIAAVGVLTAGCSAHLQDLRTRAAFDLDCSAQSLSLIELNSGNPMAGGRGAVYGVQGCGKKATYVKTDATIAGATWLMNSDSKPANKGTSAE